MLKIKTMENKFATSVVLVSSLYMQSTSMVSAEVSMDEAKTLGTTLTKFGAIKEANEDGSIPAYDGGMTTVPAGFTTGQDQYIDPFSSEEVLYKIDASNAGEYGDMLTEGTKEMLSKYPSFRLDVYKTHRTVAYPEYVLDNTIKNATTASIEGDGMVGEDDKGLPYAGVPFPLPKTGVEAMWNHNLHYAPAVSHSLAAAWLVDTKGGVTSLPSPNEFMVRPWYDQSGKMRKKTFNATYGFSARLTTPPSSAGTVFLNYYLANGEQKVWFYTPGQRRVRKAPEFAYDVPIAAYGGVLVWDEVNGFVGRMDRFDFKLVGKKEMIVPYNVFGPTNTAKTKEEILGEKHINPEIMRWEKRRVWVVEATRKDGARHIYSRRNFYIEEDCWCIVASESYDNGGKLWRVLSMLNFPTYDTGGVNNDSWTFNDMLKGNYTLINSGHGLPGYFIRSYTSGEGIPMNLTPQAVAAGSVR